MTANLITDAAGTIEEQIAVLMAELREHREKRAKEMLPWLQRRAATSDYREARECSERIRQIERDYQAADDMLVHYICRLQSLLPRPIVLTEQEPSWLRR